MITLPERLCLTPSIHILTSCPAGRRECVLRFAGSGKPSLVMQFGSQHARGTRSRWLATPDVTLPSRRVRPARPLDIRSQNYQHSHTGKA